MRISNRTPAGRRLPKLVYSSIALAAVALALAACGSSGSSGSGNGNTQSNATTHTSSSSNATLTTTKVSGYGTVLATAKGEPVYMLTADPSGGSSCTGACAKDWPPLTVTGKASGSDGADSSMISTFKRSDGSQQVLYNGHALYTHPGLSASASAGTAANGGIWYLVSPSGKPVKTTTGSGY